MVRRHLGRAISFAALILTTVALALPATAAAADYRVLVVTSADDALSKAGVSAIRSAGRSAGFSVTAPSPAYVGDQFSAKKLEQYRTVVFLNTGTASPLTDAQRANFEHRARRRFCRCRLGDRRPIPSWQFMTDILGTRSSGRTASQSGTVKVYDRVHDATKTLPEYWNRTDHWYNFTANVRGVSHVLNTVVEDPFTPQPQGNTVDGIEGGMMGFDHPLSWCKDYKGGRSFYTALGNTTAAYDAGLRTLLRGGISWAACAGRPRLQRLRSDGAPQLRADQDQRAAEPQRAHRLRPAPGRAGHPDRAHRHGPPARPGDGDDQDPRRFRGSDRAADAADLNTNSEDGLYGPAIDRNFATNKWVYLFYSPQTVTDVKLSTGEVVTQTTPTTNSPASAPTKAGWDPWVGYFQLSRFKFVEDASGPRLDLDSEQQILRMPVNRQECCHVAGDIDFDKHNNLWLVTGDDTPAGGINAGGMGPFNDQLTDEQQTVRAQGATGGTFTLTFKGQTTAPLPFDATAAQIDTALEALSSVGANNVQVTGGPVNSTTATTSVYFRRALQQADQPQLTGDGAALTGATLALATAQEGAWFQRPSADARRGALNTNDLRGKVLRIGVKDGDIAAADANGRLRSGGAYTIPAGNLFPLTAGAPQDKTRPEVYAMGFRNPFRIQVDENDVAYVSDYSPDARVNVRGRGPAGTGRFEIVRAPANYGWPVCYRRDLGFFKWSHHEWPATTPLTPAPNPNTQGVPATATPEFIADCGGATIPNTSRWNLEGGRSVEPGRAEVPPVTNPDIWYSYNDNAPGQLLGTPCQAYTQLTPGPNAPGSLTECPRLFPELGTGGVGPHGSGEVQLRPGHRLGDPKKFPPYYDEAIIVGEFTRDTMRRSSSTRRTACPQDEQSAGLRAVGRPRRPPSCATTPWTCSSETTARSTC